MGALSGQWKSLYMFYRLINIINISFNKKLKFIYIYKLKMEKRNIPNISETESEDFDFFEENERTF